MEKHARIHTLTYIHTYIHTYVHVQSGFACEMIVTTYPCTTQDVVVVLEMEDDSVAGMYVGRYVGGLPSVQNDHSS